MADTLKGRKVYFCDVPKPNDLTQVEYEALTWQEVPHIGNQGESGTDTNILDYPQLDTSVVQKQKGVTDAGNPTIQFARFGSNAGQQAMRAAALTKNYYAFKWEDDDGEVGVSSNTTYYNRGLVDGPHRPNGGVEDFNVEEFELGLVQLEIVVNSTALVAPVNSTLPSITGAAVQTGVQLTAQEGAWNNGVNSFSYQWQHDTSGNGTFVNVASGGTLKNYTPVVADVGDSHRVRVTATNVAGSTTANSLGTIPQIA